MYRPRRKYNNTKISTPFGEFDSFKEYERFLVLRALASAGEIKELKRQVEYSLIPTQREKGKGTYTKGPRKGQQREGKVLEHDVTYIADFVYTDARTGEVVVEDVKGYRDSSSAGYKVFVLKRKLMLWLHGIRVKEV